MNVTEIPFVKKVGITQSLNGELELPFTDETHNHLETMHASAQFTLAETASGEYLQTLFPDLVGKVIPVLRDASIKFKKPAVKTIIAYPSISDESRVLQLIAGLYKKLKYNLQILSNTTKASSVYIIISNRGYKIVR